MMKKYTCFLMFFLVYNVYSQDNINYRFDFFDSVGAGNYTPFWMTSNTYGTVPLKPDNGYVRGDLNWKHFFPNEIKLEAEVDILTVEKHSSSFWIQQLYAAVLYRNIYIYIGAKERYNSMLDKNLSIGDMTFSSNARPIPEINIAVANYTTIPFTKKYVKFKADFALGKSFDNDYIRRTKTDNVDYSVDILWHHKSLFLKLEDPVGNFPFSGIFGLEHASQWGGWNSHFGKNPTSLKDFARIILCQGGDSNANEGEQINILGNHLGTYNFKVTYKNENLQAALYKQHYFDDYSGLNLVNWRDGIFGGELAFFNQPFLQKVVLEYFGTTHQAGPIHFLFYDKELYPNAIGGGADNYYNNFLYTSGWSYFGRAIGNALLTSPEYNEDNALDFKNNRVKSIHLGIKGEIKPELSYRALFTESYGWGTMDKPFLKRKENFSSLVECIYKPEKLEGWQIALQAAFDKGDLYGNNLGCSLKISKSGIIGK